MKPNVLAIIMDDQRHDFLGHTAEGMVHTPHLDRLAQEGTRFATTFCTTPICTPGRAELLTGHDSYANGVRWFGQPIREDMPLLPTCFQKAGYHNIFVGKWHNDGHPSRGKGFARVRRELYQNNLNNYSTHGHYLRYEENGRTIEGHSSELFTEALLEEIESAPNDQPWFSWLAYHSPHDPFDCPEPWASAYKPEDFPVPNDFLPEPAADAPDAIIRDELLIQSPRSPAAIQQYRARYACMVSHHDACIGRILGKLEERGELNNTIVVFTSDHGLAIGSHGYLGKLNMYDHSVRVPLIFRGPGIPKGEICNGLAHHVDLFPTLAELTGIDNTPSTAGYPLFREGKALPPSRENIVASAITPTPDSPVPVGDGVHLHETQRMVRTSRWKLIHLLEANRYELYDLQEDPLEISDLLKPWRHTARRAWNYQPDAHPDDIAKVLEELRLLLP